MKPVWLGDVAWQHHLEFPEGSFRWGRLGSDFVAEWPDLLVLRTDEQGRVHDLWTDVIAPSRSIEKLRRGAAAAFVRAVRGGLSWHAASVAWDNEATLLLGESGAGKSTLAYELCERHGAALLADDVAAVSAGDSAVTVEATEPVVWLVESESPARAKEPRTTRTAENAGVLSVCVFLGFHESNESNESGDSPAIRSRRLDGVEAFERLLGATIRFIPSAGQWRRELDAIARIAGQAAVFEVIRPRTAPASATTEYVVMLKQRIDSSRQRTSRQ